MSSRKLCTAGVRGQYSYVILDNNDSAVAVVHEDERDLVTTHLNMDGAERWVDKHLTTLIGRKYEID